MKSLSSFNGYGGMAGTAADPFGPADSYGAAPVDYNGTPSQTAWYSYQSGLSGFQGHQDLHGAYGANIFQRVFTPRKWEEETGGEEGTARLFSRGTSREEREAARAEREGERAEKKSIRIGKRKIRKAKRAARKSKRRGSQYRIVRIADGTRLKQDGNNVYTFVGRPPRKSKYRHHKSGDKQARGDHHWEEIHADVLEANGPFSPGATAEDWSQLAKVSGGLGLDILKIFKGAPEDRLPDAPADTAPMQGGGIPKQFLYIGGGVLGLVLLVSLLKK